MKMPPNHDSQLTTRGAPSPPAIVLPLLAFISFILCVPPLVCHIRAQNLPAIVLVTGIIICNVQSFINALIWPSYPMETRWDGQGLCDVEVKLYYAIVFAIAGSVSCIFRQLAMILDTDRPFIRPSRYDHLKEQVVEISLCLLGPGYAMVAHYIVQRSRYWVVVVIGCYPTAYNTWVTDVLLLMWPLIIGLVAVTYCVLVVRRLLRYRRSISSILSNTSTITRARYVRLFGLASGLLLIYMPLCTHQLVALIKAGQRPYSWSVVHPPDWSRSFQVLDEAAVKTGRIYGFDRWVYVVVGFMIFLLFGLGQEAFVMYKSWLVKLGFDRWGPALDGRIPSMGSEGQRNLQRSDPSAARSYSGSTPPPRDAIDVELARIDADHIEGQRAE